MLPQFRVTGLIVAILVVCGPARAQELAPPGSDVSIHKVVIQGASTQTVKYFVKGGSPKLQALIRRVEWTENELSVIEQLQLLKVETVVNERRLAASRTALLTNPYFPTGFSPFSLGTDYGCDNSSPLQRAMTGQLAYEATPQAALQLIGFLEQQQTLLDAELKALPPKEKKAAQNPIDALLPRLAALPRSDGPPAVAPKVPAPGRVAAPLVRLPAPAAPQQVRPNQAEVEWSRTWWPAEVVKTDGDRYFIHYTGWGTFSDEWVGSNRIRMPVARR